MRYLPHLFANNRTWSAAKTRDDAAYFERLCGLQLPEYLWIGCADSRVPANDIVGLAPGELFVHRNVANIVTLQDINCLSVLQYAVDVLHVKHVIVCGHYGCGGVRAALGGPVDQPLEDWLRPLRQVVETHRRELADLTDETERWRRLCELNVMTQVAVVCRTASVRRAWKQDQRLVVHGWIYDLRDGLLKDLDVSVAGSSP